MLGTCLATALRPREFPTVLTAIDPAISRGTVPKGLPRVVQARHASSVASLVISSETVLKAALPTGGAAAVAFATTATDPATSPATALRKGAVAVAAVAAAVPDPVASPATDLVTSLASVPAIDGVEEEEAAAVATLISATSAAKSVILPASVRQEDRAILKTPVAFAAARPGTLPVTAPCPTPVNAAPRAVAAAEGVAPAFAAVNPVTSLATAPTAKKNDEGGGMGSGGVFFIKVDLG